MTCAVYSIIHHPLSERNSGQGVGLPVVHPHKRGACYGAERCSTSLSRCRAVSPDAPGNRPPRCGDRYGRGGWCSAVPARHSAAPRWQRRAAPGAACPLGTWSSPPSFSLRMVCCVPRYSSFRSFAMVISRNDCSNFSCSLRKNLCAPQDAVPLREQRPSPCGSRGRPALSIG